MHKVEHIYMDGTFSLTPVLRRPGNGSSAGRRLPDTLEEALDEEEDVDEEQQRATRRSKFSQVYVILAERKERDRVFVTPILHALLPDKTTATYEKLWRMVRSVFPTLNPSTFSSDYELPAINAVLNSYHNKAALLGCGFHYSHSINKQARKKKVEKLFREKTCLYVKVGQWTSLASVYPHPYIAGKLRRDS